VSDAPPLPARRLSRRSLYVYAGAACGLAGAVLLGVGVWEGVFAGRTPAVDTSDITSSPLLGKPAPALDVAGFDGAPVSLAALRGKPALLNFWATWCGPCKEELPLLQRFADAQHGRWTVLGVDELESASDVRAFAQSLHVAYPLALDRDGAAGQRYRVGGLPSTFILDAQGIVRAVHLGPLTADLLAGYAKG
jgi:cytochrome c biogenesis protein CcmG/thiol:disulfide interchange protein DsbE